LQLAKGSHRLLVERGGFENVERDIIVEPGRPNTVQVLLDPTPDTRATFVSKAMTQRTWGWVTVGVGGALLAGGMTYYFLNQPKKDDAQTAYDAALHERDTLSGICDWPSGKGSVEACNAQLDQKYNTLQDKKHLSNYALIGAGVGAAVAGVGVFIVASGDSPHKYDRERPSEGSARIRAVPTASFWGGGGTLGVAGVF
jgi:hypothetical protein